MGAELNTYLDTLQNGPKINVQVLFAKSFYFFCRFGGSGSIMPPPRFSDRSNAPAAAATAFEMQPATAQEVRTLGRKLVHHQIQV